MDYIDELRNQFAKEGYLDPDDMYALLWCSSCLQNHYDPQFRECTQTGCSHFPEFGYRFGECNSAHTPLIPQWINPGVRLCI